MEFRCWNSSFTKASEADDLGNDKWVSAVILSLADIHSPQSIWLNSVDYMDGVPLMTQMGVKRQPVVPGSFHSKDDIIRSWDVLYPIHQFVEAGMRVGKTNGLSILFSRCIHDTGFMITFADVDAYDIHAEHSFGSGFVWLRLSFSTGHTLLRNEKTAHIGLLHPAHQWNPVKGEVPLLYSADSAARRKRKPHPYDGIISSAYWLLIPNLNLYSRRW